MISLANHDVVVVGAGPAGAHTALRLARLGRTVALLDARTFPRPKPCGEFLSPACLPLLDEVGLLEEVLAREPARVTGMHLVTRTSAARGRFAPFGRYAASHGFGLGIRREVLDTLAVEAAEHEPRITVLTGRRVGRVLRDDSGRASGVEVVEPDGARRTLASRFVVGADGLRSRVARDLGLVAERTGPARFAVVARFLGVPERERAHVHFLGRDYVAACPIDEETFTANLVVDGGTLPKGTAALEEHLRARLAEDPRLGALLGAAPLAEPLAVCGPLGARTTRCHAPGAALVGDACGFVDPLTGEGLYFAMRGARLLAPAVDRALADPTAEQRALRAYARARRRELAPRYALARLLQRGLRRSGTPERVVGLLQRLPGVCDLVLGLTGDYVPPAGLASPRVWSRALFGADTNA